MVRASALHGRPGIPCRVIPKDFKIWYAILYCQYGVVASQPVYCTLFALKIHQLTAETFAIYF